MSFLSRALSHRFEGWVAAITFGPSYYVGLVLLGLVAIAVFVHAHGVWVEIHDVEEPDSPSDRLGSFEEAHAAGELDDQELERLRQILRNQDSAPPK